MGPLVQMPMDPLSDLRDIHLPPPPPWWPPAPGWWLLAVAGLALAAVGLRLALAAWRRGRRRRAATRALQRLRKRYEGGAEVRELTAELATVVRRAAMIRHPRARVAGLTGRAWLEFLDDDAHQFTAGVGRHLATAPYARDEAVDLSALLALCEKWVKQNT